jgi:hypothetical protein
MDYTAIIVIAALVVFILGRRLIGSRKGTSYSVRSIFLRPIIYLVLSVILVLGLQLWQTAVLIVAIVLGGFAGLELGKRSDIFEKDGKILYRRSNEVLAIWIIAFVIRIAIDFITDPALFEALTSTNSSISISAIDVATAASQSNPLIFVADILLAFSAGLLFGEALVLYRNFNSKYKNAK